MYDSTRLELSCFISCMNMGFIILVFSRFTVALQFPDLKLIGVRSRRGKYTTKATVRYRISDFQENRPELLTSKRI